MRQFVRELFSSEKYPSIRLVGAGLLLATVVGLEIWFATAANVMEMINSDLIAVGTYFGIGSARMVGTALANNPAPTVDNSKTEITSEQTDVSANNVTMKDAAPE